MRCQIATGNRTRLDSFYLNLALVPETALAVDEAVELQPTLPKFRAAVSQGEKLFSKRSLRHIMYETCLARSVSSPAMTNSLSQKRAVDQRSRIETYRYCRSRLLSQGRRLPVGMPCPYACS